MRPSSRQQPVVRFTTVDGANVAWSEVGEGPPMVLMPSWFSNIETIWDLPPAASFLDRLAEFARVIMFDRRGTGLSDDAPNSSVLDNTCRDLLGVLDAAGHQRAALIACDGAGPIAIVAAATHPERIRQLGLVATFARLAHAHDYPAGTNPRTLHEWEQLTVIQWSGTAGFDINAPTAVGDRLLERQFTRYLRSVASPGCAARIRAMLHEIDVRAVLPTVHVPTTVLHRCGDRMIPVEHARYLARSMANARLIELDGDDHLFYIGDQRELLGEIELLVTGTHRPAPSRVLSTVVFTDIVESTAEAQRQGDSEWRVTLDRHDAICAGEVARFGGRVIKTTGDGLLATFDRPTSAIECTTAIARSTRHLGLQLRAGIHTGEVEQRDGDITGIAVVIARRLCDLADADTTCVSRTVTDLVIGSDLTFVLIGERELKGIAGTWAIYQLSIDTQDGSAASS